MESDLPVHRRRTRFGQVSPASQLSNDEAKTTNLGSYIFRGEGNSRRRGAQGGCGWNGRKGSVHGPWRPGYASRPSALALWPRWAQGGSYPGVRALILAMKSGNSDGAKERRKVDV
jgi:hypothetical protein